MGTIKEESNPFSDEAKKIVQEILEEMLVRVLEKPEYEQQMVNHLSIHLYIRELEIIEDICTSLFSLSLSLSFLGCRQRRRRTTATSSRSRQAASSRRATNGKPLFMFEKIDWF